MLRATGIAKSFTLHLRGDLRLDVLRDAAITVGSGECVALAGPSGAGKSTLLRALYGNYLIDQGEILIRHQGAMTDIAKAAPELMIEIRSKTIGHVSQFLRVIPRVPAIDIVAGRLTESGAEEDAARRRAAALLDRLGIPARLHALPPATFSGGEQQRVNLACGFIRFWPILLLDEPTASLDDANREIVIGLIREAKAAGSAVVGIFHDMYMREAVADRILHLDPIKEQAKEQA